MAQGIAALGIDVWAIIFQLINFAILFLLLQRFAFRPLLKILKDRQQKIAESLHTASQVSEIKKDTEKEQKMLLVKARKDAEDIVQQAKEYASKLIDDAKVKAELEVEKEKEAAQQEIARDISAAQAGLRTQAARLVIQATGKIIGETLNQERDEALISRALDEVL